jgi:hypothetical protein
MDWVRSGRSVKTRLSWLNFDHWYQSTSASKVQSPVVQGHAAHEDPGEHDFRGQGLAALGQARGEDRVELGVARPDLGEVGGAVVARLHLVPVVHARGERVADLGQRADVEAEADIGVAREIHVGPVDDALGEGVHHGHPALQRHRREAHVEAQAQREPVRELVADGGIDREALELGLLGDEPSAERVRAGPGRGQAERRVQADAEYDALAEGLRVIHGRRHEQAGVSVLRHPGPGERIGAGEGRGGMDEGPAEVELLALQERDAGGVMEDGAGVVGLGRERARESHSACALLEYREPGRVRGHGAEDTGHERRGQSPSGFGHQDASSSDLIGGSARRRSVGRDFPKPGLREGTRVSDRKRRLLGVSTKLTGAV